MGNFAVCAKKVDFLLLKTLGGALQNGCTVELVLMAAVANVASGGGDLWRGFCGPQMMPTCWGQMFIVRADVCNHEGGCLCCYWQVVYDLVSRCLILPGMWIIDMQFLFPRIQTNWKVPIGDSCNKMCLPLQCNFVNVSHVHIQPPNFWTFCSWLNSKMGEMCRIFLELKLISKN